MICNVITLITSVSELRVLLGGAQGGLSPGLVHADPGQRDHHHLLQPRGHYEVAGQHFKYVTFIYFKQRYKEALIVALHARWIQLQSMTGCVPKCTVR